ncbi:MAG: response regulator [Gemmatimonadales bacterium]
MSAPDELDKSALDLIREVGGQHLLNEVLDTFFETAAERLTVLRAAVSEGDVQQAGRAAHSLVSSASAVGAARVASLARDLEQHAEAGATDSLGALLAQLEGSFESATRLLALERTEAAGSSADQPSDTGDRRATIAVVEDNADNRLLLHAILEDHYEIVEYASGVEALEALPTVQPDLIVLDISLPGLDGTEVLAEVRRMPRLAAVPTVALTAHAMAGDREKYLAAGFDEYLTKPILDEDALLDTIARLLKR